MNKLIYIVTFFVTIIVLTTTSCNKASTCSDGVQNGNETGIDCGGSCSSCSSSTLTSTTGQCTDEVILEMFGKLYGQIADTSTLNYNTVWPYPDIVKYFSITDSSSAETIYTPCRGGGYTLQNYSRRLYYYFQSIFPQYNSISNKTELIPEGKIEFKLGSDQGDIIYGSNCSLNVPIYTTDYCPLFFMDTIYGEGEHTSSLGLISNDLKFINFTDSIYVIDIHRQGMQEYSRDTATYYLID